VVVVVVVVVRPFDGWPGTYVQSHSIFRQCRNTLLTLPQLSTSTRLEHSPSLLCEDVSVSLLHNAQGTFILAACEITLTSLVTFTFQQVFTMPPRPINFQPLKDFGDKLIFYLAILPLAFANPNVLKEHDSRREQKKNAKEDEVKSSEMST
jgi:hypothetical protein